MYASLLIKSANGAREVNMSLEQPQGVGRRGFLAVVGGAAAALGLAGFFKFRKSPDRRKDAARILGVREDSLLMPRDQDLDRLFGE